MAQVKTIHLRTIVSKTRLIDKHKCYKSRGRFAKRMLRIELYMNNDLARFFQGG